MQLMIDTDTETLAGLRAVAVLVAALIGTRIGEETSDIVPPAPATRDESGLPDESLDPARAFGVPAGTSNVLPFPQPPVIMPVNTAPANLTASAPQAPTTTPPNVSHVTTTAAAGQVAPGVMSQTVTNGSADSAAVMPGVPPMTGVVLPAASNVTFDSAGLPWDERIHSDTHKQNADGSWRFRRNLDEAVKAAVLGELRGLNPAAPVVPASPPVLPVGSDTAGPAELVPVPPSGMAVVVPQVPTPPVTVPLPPPAPGAVPVPPSSPLGVPLPPQQAVVPPPPVTNDSIPTPPAPPSGEVMDFRALLKRINKGIAAGTLTHPKVLEACKSAGLEGITGLATTPAAVPIVAELLKV